MKDPRDLYLRFAKLARLGQETEVSVSIHNLFVHWIRSGFLGEPSPDQQMALRLRRMTFGQGVRHLDQQYARTAADTEPDELKQLHTKATAARNELIHHFFLEYTEDFSEPGELTRAEQELEELADSIEKAHYVYSESLNNLERLLREAGILASESST